MAVKANKGKENKSIQVFINRYRKVTPYLVLFLIVGIMAFGTWWVDHKDTLRIPLGDGYLYGDLLKSEESSGDVVFILIAGSGPTDRDGNSEILDGKNDALKAIAYGLKEKGYSTFRYDQRSAGKTKQQTTKDLLTITIEDMVDDLTRVIQTMKYVEKFDTIILVGHSQGSLVAAIAAQMEAVDGYISLCGPTRPIDQVLIWQLEQQQPKELAEMKSVINSLKQGTAVYDMSENTEKLFGTRVQPFLISWMAYNPVDVFNQLTVPKLFLFGSEDLQVPSSDSKALESLSSSTTIKVIQGMNHVLKQVKVDNEKDNLASYTDPSYALHHELITVLTDFAEGVK